jgi:ABC-2 type transport system ATP-binding protein
MDTARALLTTDRLSKRYRDGTRALDELTISVAAGEVYGFLGSNGAGKSTTIRTLLGFLQPTSGSARICDLDIVRDSVAVKRHVGYLAGDIALYNKVTGNELFAYLSDLQQKDNRSYLQELITRFEAEPHKPIGELSKGNRQKIGIIQALMHQPDVLILDEPTSGLDPLMQEVFYAVIREAAGRGTSVFVSSHNLAEAQRMCDRIGIIKHGRLIHEQAVTDNDSASKPTFRVVLVNEKDGAQLGRLTHLDVLSRKGATFTARPTGTIAEALGDLARLKIAHFATQQTNLEDDFLEYYGDGA